MRLALRDRTPGAPALALRQVGMPDRRIDAEALPEPVEPLRGQRDLRQQHQRLPAGGQRLGHRLEVDLGLARAGDAVEQRDPESVPGDGLPQSVGRCLLRPGKGRAAVVGLRGLERRRGRQFDGL